MLPRVYFLLLGISWISLCASSRIRKHGGSNGRHLKSYGIGGHHVRRNASSFATSSSIAGLWPSVFNLATKAVISANATCGETGREEFCRMVEGGKGRCGGVCDNASGDPGKRHPIDYAIDGTNRWWQSPALHYGRQYEYVTVTLDLKQVYQIAYIIVKSANSPRPGTWILERSFDNENYEPWQYFARNDKECIERFGIPPTKGKPHYFTDSEVICTSFYSRLTPTENGEIHTSLVHGRPGANETSPELLEFTKARYVRLRLMGLRGNVEPLPRWFSQDISREKRLYYTIRDISIGGQCVCNGHAENCRHNVASGHPECECSHHTCGPNCERCCALFNQRQWGPGSARDSRQCLPCNCHGHANSCHYDEDVDRTGLSMDVHGNYQGGGVCDNCTAYTSGINCEQCMPGYFRPFGVSRDAEKPCLKCDCDPAGSSGKCVQEGERAGTCDCLSGYDGRRCDRCASGHRGWPLCEACPCDPRGTLPGDNCEGQCRCKTNVEGKLCERCKSGYFGLSADSSEGCSVCFCSDVTTVCEMGVVATKRVQTLQKWLITDLKVTETAQPSWDDKGLFSIGNYELPDVESLFWLAPQPYLGNKLEYYDSVFTFKVHWVIMRGDTSGKSTTGPNLMLVGTNGLKIAHGNDFYHSSNMTFHVRLSEEGWYHIPPDVKDIVTRLKRTEYKGDQVTRRQFLSVLTSLKRVLLRATFHTDQIESLLEEATLEDGRGAARVERCSCPSGYSGLSCESCSFGYVRIMANASGSERGFCGKCDCNGHSESCDADTGECFCRHDTVGESCERCRPGFYGNPLHGTEADCKKCACPLDADENNFSPSCQLDYSEGEDGDKFVCTQCPRGYTGDHCEICDDGFYGDPMEPGNGCKACNCNGGPCDRKTGQCLSCKGNTEGWKCERCKSEYYGDAASSNCQSCQCDPLGSASRDCHNETGQCECKERFTGRTCDKCETGFGNVTAFCTPCSCNPTGSKSSVCDPHTGLCDCRSGVEGFHCDACQNLHYGFSEAGCTACNCDPHGSQFPTCDVTTGQCRCHPHNVGLKCDKCEDGYWKRETSCVPCNCQADGATSQNCDPNTGVCHCKPGVGGERCNECLPKHFGSLTKGCKECDPCFKEGHICDPNTGRCVCPHLTIGLKCEKCTKHSWGYEPGIGCKSCDCSSSGSTHLQCDSVSGRCTCRIGFEGEKCDRCSHGFYSTSRTCQKCNCNTAGTLAEDCEHDSCTCSDQGCRCKANVVGKKCDSCKDGTFWVDRQNNVGCTDCFCFARSRKCISSDFSWDQIRTNHFEDDLCDGRTCWRLPEKFLGDLTLSYGGYLRIASSVPISYSVYITGNGFFVTSITRKPDIKMVEDNWQLKSTTSTINRHILPENCLQHLSRECFMVVLQKVTDLHIEPHRAQRARRQAEEIEILLDKAGSFPGLPAANSVEQCHCPPEYTGSSCQDPSEGFYRHHPKELETNNYIDQIIGVARRCQCNGKSSICDRETGHCKYCTYFTTGPHCELCAEGYYKNQHGICLPCMCPSKTQNFAQSCTLTPEHDSICTCKSGYTGPKCNKCEDGYWGNPHQENGLCQKCNCNPYGSESLNCHKLTGSCQCKSGFTGIRCSECFSPREVIQNGVCTPCDKCTQILFNTIDSLGDGLNKTLEIFKDGLGPPWPVLNETLARYNLLSKRYNSNIAKASDLVKHANIPLLEGKIVEMRKDLKKKNQVLSRQVKSIDALYSDFKVISSKIKVLDEKINDIIKNLDNFGNSHVDTADALKEAEQILTKIRKRVQNVPSSEDYNRLIKSCNDLLKQVNEIYESTTINPETLRQKLTDLKRRISTLNTILEHTNVINKLTRNKNKQNTVKIARLGETITALNSNKSIANAEIEETLRRINATSEILNQIDAIQKLLANLDLEETRDKLEDDDASNDSLYQILSSVGEHVKNLENKLRTYKGLFNFTKEEWKKIDASGAYDNLIKGIDEAERNAIATVDVLKNVTKALYPDGEDSLPDKAILSEAFSDRLRQRIINLKNPNQDFKKTRDQLESLKYAILNNGRKNNDLTSTLHNLRQQLKKQLYHMNDLDKVKDDADNVIDRMAAIDQAVKDINITNQYELMKMYQKYLNLTSGDAIDKLMNKIVLTKAELQNINNINLTHIDKIRNTNKEKFQNTEQNLNTLSKTIDSLKNKIKYANEAAEAINIAISISNCKRRYSIQEDVFDSLVITFKCETCTLLTLTNNKKESLSLSVKNNVVHLKWKTFKRKIKGSPQTTTITLKKTASEVYFQIEQEKGPDKAESINDKELFVISGRKLEIGTLSNGENSACLHKVVFNNKVIGLWRFDTTEGNCPGCQKDTNSTGQHVFFGGNGYRNVTGSRTVNPTRVAARFEFKTFDENSLIFLAQDKTDLCSYIGLSLNDGHLELKLRHVDGTNVTLTSKEKYNDGKEQTVDMLLEYNQLEQQQSYSLEPGKEDRITINRTFGGGNVFKIRKSEVFIGGISPTVDNSCIKVNTTSFLGYLKPGNAEYSDPVSTSSYNTWLQSGELEFNNAWFPGSGFLDLDLNTELKRPFTIHFLLRPTTRNGFVMNFGSFLDIYVKDSRLAVKIRKVNEEEHVFPGRLENEVNVIEIRVEEDTLNVTINNENPEILEILNEVEDKDITSRLYMGTDETGVIPKYRGGISNIAINNSAIMFGPETIRNFSHVEIGRQRPIVTLRGAIGGPSDSNSIKDNNIMQNTEGCPTVSSYETDPNAVKLGDKPDSYVRVDNSFWKKNCTLTLQFRTFYPNGLLFISIGANQLKHYNILEIKGGKLYLRIKGKKPKERVVTTSQKVNDGKWHTIHLTHEGIGKKRRMSVALDGKPFRKPMKMPKNNLKSEVYFGGIPESSFTNYQNYEIHAFRGCLRSIRINNQPQILTKNKSGVIYNNVGQCFPNVEKGAYFGGDAYAIYKNDFRVNKVLELSFEFRTVEQNGILLSVSNRGNSPALSVELQNGAVVMTIDMGNGAISNVTNSLDSDFTLCNNRWHYITALYSSSELTVNVDGIRKSWVQSDVNSLMDEIQAPLFVGGLPDNAPSGTLRIKENFKGCIRNLKIEDNLMDWSDMKELNNVLLNSCPVVTP